jgi:hypothetical protein
MASQPDCEEGARLQKCIYLHVFHTADIKRGTQSYMARGKAPLPSSALQFSPTLAVEIEHREMAPLHS